MGEGGHVLNASFLGWEDVPLGRDLEAELGLPVVVDNDLLSFTRAEQWFGSARRCRHFAVVTIGEGLGTASSCATRCWTGPTPGWVCSGTSRCCPADRCAPTGTRAAPTRC